ncbi:MAG: hypothetical protein WBL46_04470 [Nitrososphaeraceae archaeon]
MRGHKWLFSVEKDQKSLLLLDIIDGTGKAHDTIRGRVPMPKLRVTF